MHVYEWDDTILFNVKTLYFINMFYVCMYLCQAQQDQHFYFVYVSMYVKDDNKDNKENNNKNDNINNTNNNIFILHAMQKDTNNVIYAYSLNLKQPQ